jgi:hypothetical protein
MKFLATQFHQMKKLVASFAASPAVGASIPDWTIKRLKISVQESVKTEEQNVKMARPALVETMNETAG